MTYAIANVVVGVLWTDELEEYRQSLDRLSEGDEAEGEYFEELDQVGFETFYRGSGDKIPAFCGVQISEFDECSDFPVSELKLQATAEQIAEAKKKIEDNIERPDIKKRLGKFDVWILWSSS